MLELQYQNNHIYNICHAELHAEIEHVLSLLQCSIDLGYDNSEDVSRESIYGM